MKISELKEMLKEMKDDDDVFVLLFDKESFDFDPDDEMWLPAEKWAMIVAELEEVSFDSLRSDIFDAVVEYGELKEDDETETPTA
jgi:hypothetical protein